MAFGRGGLHLIIGADGRSATRELDRVARKTHQVSEQMHRDGKRSSSGFDQMGRSAGRLRGAVGGLAGTVGLGGLAFGIKDVLTAGEHWQAQQSQLQNALRNTGRYSKETYNQLSEAAEKMATHGGFAATDNLQALTRFVTATGSVSKSQRDLRLATDISRQSGFDFTRVVRALMMAEGGRTTGLARMGIVLGKTTSAHDKLAQTQYLSKLGMEQLVASGVKFSAQQKAQYNLTHQITPEMLAQAKAADKNAAQVQAFALLEARYHGAASRYSNTTSGRINNMRNQWEQLKKSLGQGLLPVMNKVVGVLAKSMHWLNKHRPVLYALLGLMGAFSAAVAFNAVVTTLATTRMILMGEAAVGTSTALGIATGATETMSAAAVAFSAVMTATVIGAIIVGLVLLVTHFKDVKAVAVAAFHVISHAASAAVRWIGRHWKLLAVGGAFFLGGPFAAAAVWAATHFKTVKRVATDVWHFLTRLAHKIWDALTWPFRKAGHLISSVLHGAVHAAGSVLHTASFGLLAGGGVVRPRYFASGGPSGTDTVPGWLTPGEGVVNTRGMQLLGNQGLGALNAGHTPAFHGGRAVEQPIVVQVRLDSRVVAQAVTRAVINRAARGPTSFVGGALVTGPQHAA